jgi:cytochrome c oxidase subunit 4
MANDDKPDTEAPAEKAPEAAAAQEQTTAHKSEPPAVAKKSEPPAAAAAEPAKKSEPPAAAAAEPAKKSEPPAAAASPAPTKPDEVGSDGDGEPVADQAKPAALVPHEEAAHEDHGLAHTMPIWMLVAVLAALMFLTILTVSVTNYDLGSEGNLVVGMVIATIKAGLVITFFMHLLWDKKFHLILFLTAVLFVVLFLSMSITDRGEYQGNIDLYQSTTTSAAAK